MLLSCQLGLNKRLAAMPQGSKPSVYMTDHELKLIWVPMQRQRYVFMLLNTHAA